MNTQKVLILTHFISPCALCQHDSVGLSWRRMDSAAPSSLLQPAEQLRSVVSDYDVSTYVMEHRKTVSVMSEYYMNN